MAILSTVKVLIVKWINQHPNQLCAGLERTTLIAAITVAYTTAHKAVTPAQIQKQLQYLLGKHRPIIQPNKTNFKYEKQPIGGATSHSKERKKSSTQVQSFKFQISR